jgi:hypothetical protein
VKITIGRVSALTHSRVAIVDIKTMIDSRRLSRGKPLRSGPSGRLLRQEKQNGRPKAPVAKGESRAGISAGSVLADR